MFGHFGFSYVGLIFLCCLFIPNILFAKNPPRDRLDFRENRFLLVLERAGQALCTVLVLVCRDTNFHGFEPWAAWLGASAVLTALYLVCWARYFRGEHIERDFLRPFWVVPLPLATLPVAAVLLLAAYGRALGLGVAGVILGIGHVGITAQHWTAVRNKSVHSDTARP